MVVVAVVLVFTPVRADDTMAPQISLSFLRVTMMVMSCLGACCNDVVKHVSLLAVIGR